MKIPGMHYQDASWGKVGDAVAAALTDSIFSTLDDHGREHVCASVDTVLDHLSEIWVTAEQLLLTRSYKNFKNERNCHQRDGHSLALDLILALLTDMGPASDPDRNSTQESRLPWPLELADVLVGQKSISRTAIKKTCRNLLSEVRDEMDVQGFQAIPELQARFEALQAVLPPGKQRKNATLAISVPHLLRMRMVDQALGEFRWFLEDWRAYPEKIGEFFGIEILPGVEPLEVYRARKLLADGHCSARWLLEYYAKFAPRSKDLVSYKGPILAGKKVLDNLWALKSLEVRIDQVIVELREYALLSGVQNNDVFVMHGADGREIDPNDPDVVDRILSAGWESLEREENRLLGRPEDAAAEEAKYAKNEDEAASEHDDDQDEDPVDQEVVDWDVPDNREKPSDSPGNESTSADDDDDQKIIHVRKCLERFPLAIQVGVLIAVYPSGDADLLELLTNMNVFGRWEMAPALRPLTPKFLAKKHEPPLGEKTFAGKVNVAKEAFLNCCRRRFQQAADDAEGV